MASDMANAMHEIIKLMGDLSFKKLIDKTPDGKAKFDSMSANGQELFRMTYQMGYVDGSIEALAMTQGVSLNRLDKSTPKADLSYDEWLDTVDPRNANPDDGTGE